MDLDILAQQYKALSEPARLRILEILPVTSDCDGVYNVSELAEELGIPQPTISHHLKILQRAGLVRCDRMCRDVYYWVDMAVIEKTLAHLREIALPR